MDRFDRHDRRMRIPEKYAGLILAVGERDLGLFGTGVRFADRRREHHRAVLLAGAQSNGLVCNVVMSN